MNLIKEAEEMLADYARPNSTTDGGNLYALMPKLVTRIKELENVLEEFSKLETIVAPDGRRWPLGQIAKEVLKGFKPE